MLLRWRNCGRQELRALPRALHIALHTECTWIFVHMADEKRSSSYLLLLSLLHVLVRYVGMALRVLPAERHATNSHASRWQHSGRLDHVKAATQVAKNHGPRIVSAATMRAVLSRSRSSARGGSCSTATGSCRK